MTSASASPGPDLGPQREDLGVELEAVPASRALIVPGGAGNGMALVVPLSAVGVLEFFANGQVQRIVFREPAPKRGKKRANDQDGGSPKVGEEGG